MECCAVHRFGLRRYQANRAFARRRRQHYLRYVGLRAKVLRSAWQREHRVKNMPSFIPQHELVDPINDKLSVVLDTQDLTIVRRVSPGQGTVYHLHGRRRNDVARVMRALKNRLNVAKS